MEGFPDIINTTVVPAEWDALWKEQTGLKDFKPKPVLVLSSPYQEGRSEEAQLKKILAACQLNEDDYNIIQIIGNQLININYLLNELNIKTVLLFGVLPYQLGISAQFVLNAPNHFNNCIFIPALSIPEMEQKPEMKSRLWNDALKPLFASNK